MLKIVLSLFALTFSLHSPAQDQAPQQTPIMFSLMTIPVYIEQDKTGPMYQAHQEILNAVSHQTNLIFDSIVAPPLRAQQTFISHGAAALMPDFCDSTLGVPNVHSVPFGRAIRYILTPPNLPTINNYNDLKGKKVGLVRGYAYELEGPSGEGVNLIWTTSQRQTLRMLNSGRLDAIVANLEEISEIANSEGISMPSVDKEHPVLDRSLCYVFHDSPLGRVLALEVSAQIIALRRQGKLEQYIGQNHIPDYRPTKPEVR